MTRQTSLPLAMAGCLALCAGPAPAAAWTAHEASADVKAAILATLPKDESRIAEIGPSAAVRMGSCLSPLTVSIMGRGSYRTAKVDCASPLWTIYVEVSLARMEDVLIAIRNIPIGHLLAVEDFRAVRVVSDDLSGEPVSARDAIGRQVAIPLAPGETITRNQIVIPPTIHNGDKIMIYCLTAGVMATATGTALESGSLGQSILVENDDSHRGITATILPTEGPAKIGQPFIIAPK
jgi:flagellar basal body P-ring formation protein FlgA